MPAPPTDPVERVLARVEKRGDCWVFMGAKSQGYGVVQLGRGVGTDRTHRVIYRAMVGPIPEGFTLDHLCGNRACCNPKHLEPTTRAENTRRQWKARPVAFNRAKTHCPQGHPYTEENTYLYRGRRNCRICIRRRSSNRPSR